MAENRTKAKTSNFASNLKSALYDQRLNATDLARKINASPKTISDWLAGRTPRNLQKVREAAKALDVSVHYLLFGEEEKRPGPIEKELEKILVHSGLYEITVRKVAKDQ
ncbi:MAG: helix-turn-helix transcriptional regulator [Bdellovibrionota bacterium]